MKIDEKIENKQKFEFSCRRRPTTKGMPLKGYKPIRGDEINFLDVTNDGLMLGQSPNKRSCNFLDGVFADAMHIDSKEN